MFFDTRYFWAVLTAKDREATIKLKALFDRSKPAYTSSVCLFEVYKLTLASEGKDVAELRTATIERDFQVVAVDAEIAREGAVLAHRLQVPMADAMIMATAKRLHLACVTDDPHFTEVKRVWV
ncbi:MAG: PIN domain-containing protein [Nitrososphaerota archaeon]|nr:PIN domain-containing protein [Nitrososphaerota archaeon]